MAVSSRKAAIGTSRIECLLPAYIGNLFSIRSELYFSIQFQLSAQKGYSSGLRYNQFCFDPSPSRSVRKKAVRSNRTSDVHARNVAARGLVGEL